MMQRSTFYPVIGSVSIPDPNHLHTKTEEELSMLRPTHICMADKFASFGMTMSDGNTQQAGKHPCTATHELPARLTLIEVVFNVEDNNIHSIRFTGDSELVIGSSDKDDIGRIEKCFFEESETLLGCEIQYSKSYSEGIIWLKWKPPLL